MSPRPLKTALSSLLLIALAHFGYAQTGTISFGIAAPTAGQAVDSNVSIQANLIISTYQIRAVVATVQNRSVSLTTGGGGVYSGTLSLGGLPAGEKDTLIIVATDVNGNSQADSETFIYDYAPKVTIVKPYEGTVGRPTLNVQASCAPSSGHCQMQVVLRVPTATSPIVVGNYTDSVNATIDVSAYEGLGSCTVTVTGVDQYNMQSYDARDFYVETSPYLTPVYTSDNPIVDFLGTKVMSWNNVATTMPRIGDLTNATVTSLPFNGQLPSSTDVHLSSQGVVFVGEPAGATHINLYDWNSGNMDSLTPDIGLSKIIVNGNYCVWNFNNSLYFRNLATQTTMPAGTGIWNDVSASGVGAYYRSNSTYDSILLYQNGSATGVQSNSNGYPLLNPVTDGTNAAYIQQDLSNNKSIYRYDAKTGTNSLLSSLTASPLPPSPFYLVNNGYTAFISPDAALHYQAWTRDTAGNNIQASPFSLPSTLERLAPNGQLAFFNGTVYTNGLRYIYDPKSAALLNICSGLGKSYYQNSGWYVAIGNTLFQVNLNIGADKADSFAIPVKEDSLYAFSTNDFASHYHTSGSLMTVTIAKLPAHGSLTLNGVGVALNQVVPRSGLSTLVYTPLANFAGSDTVVWTGSNGFTTSPASALLVINVDSVLPTVPPAPKIGGLNAGYCSNYGQPVGFNVTNMPAAYMNATVIATLDGQPLAITPGGVMSVQPWTMAVGSHSVVVFFTNSLGSDTSSATFQIVQASTPTVKLTANPSTLTTSTTQVVLTASDVSGGGTAPLYTFSTDYSFNSHILQAESSSNTLTLAVASLTIGRNVIYVRMATSDTCSTTPIGVDSVVLDRVQDTAVAPPAPKISGLIGDYCHNAGAQQVSISNMPSAGSGVTVAGALDGQPVTVSSVGAITLQPQTLSVGTHTLAVIFADAAGADTTTGSFRIDSAVTPAVKLTVDPTPLTTTTQEFELLATPVGGSSGAPLWYTFATTANFSLPTILQAGTANATTVSVNTLVAGNNVYYVRMQTFDSCVTSSFAIDSVVIVKPVDSAGSPQGGMVTAGPNPFAGTITIGGLQTSKSYGITVTNAFGQVLITQVAEGQTQAVLLTGMLPRGVYFLRVYDQNSGKVVKTSILLSANR